MKINTSVNAELPQAPISRNAYLELIARIYHVYGEGSGDAVLMLREVDFYIKHGYYSGRLMRDMEAAFMFLKQDIDVAMERSRVARERARLRREGADRNAKVEPQIMIWRKRTLEKYKFEGDRIVIKGSTSSIYPFIMDFARRDVKERYRNLCERLAQPAT